MSLTTMYCVCTDCKHHDGVGCSLDFTTIGDNGGCLGKENIRLRRNRNGI